MFRVRFSDRFTSGFTEQDFFVHLFLFCLKKSIQSGVPVFVLSDIIKTVTFYIRGMSAASSCRCSGGRLTAQSRKQMAAKRLRLIVELHIQEMM